MNEPVKHVTLVDEAPVVFGKNGTSSTANESIDPSANAAEIANTTVAQCRKYGMGTVFTCQSIAQLPDELLKNIGTKCFGRISDLEDRERAGSAVLMSEIDKQNLGRLKVGQSYLYSDGFFEPMQIQHTDLSSRIDLSTVPADDRVHEAIRETDWFRETREAIENQNLCVLDERMEEFSADLQVLVNGASELSKSQQSKKLQRVGRVEVARKLKEELMHLQKAFEFSSFTPLIGTDFPADSNDLRDYRNHLRDRYGKQLLPLLKRCAALFDQITEDKPGGTHSA